MSKNGSSRSSAPGKGGSLLLGILIGMVLGMAVAVAVAWYLLKAPNLLAGKDAREAAQPAPEAAKPVPAKTSAVPGAPLAASGVAEGKPRFEFYKVLTDKQDAAPPPLKDGGKVEARAVAKESYMVQAGAFSSADDADKLKAKLAMLGMEANVQAVTLPDKGVVHRVRLGPYKSADEMNKTLVMLKQNGVNATPIRAQ
ncbi:MAG: sporulation domain-containing protein [Gallionellaceae bacterium]|nr:MAG: sporulation domain-containing protein [Gallionellaceae bacterium]